MNAVCCWNPRVSLQSRSPEIFLFKNKDACNILHSCIWFGTYTYQHLICSNHLGFMYLTFMCMKEGNRNYKLSTPMGHSLRFQNVQVMLYYCNIKVKVCQSGSPYMKTSYKCFFVLATFKVCT